METEVGLRINGRNIPDVSLLPCLARLIKHESESLASFTTLVEEAYQRGEFAQLAKLLMDAELSAAASVDGLRMESEESIVLRRDTVATIFLTRVARSEAGEARSQNGIRVARRIDILANDVALFAFGGEIDLRKFQLVQGVGGEFKVRDVGLTCLRDGAHLVVNRGRHGFESEAVRGDVWLLQVVMGAYEQLIRHFDRDTLRPLGVSSASYHATRMEFIVDLLVRLPPPDVSLILKRIARTSEFHFVRWKALKALVEVDYEDGFSELEHAGSNDSHPHVRRAAQRSIDALSTQV